MPNLKPTVTIGIPAYNEASNIALLLKSLLSQHQSGYKLQQILVISDASTDNTVAIIKSLKKSIVTVIDGHTRKGQALRQNQIAQHTNSDFLLILNADISISDPNFISKFIEPFKVSTGIGLVGAKVLPLPSKTFLGRTLDWHMYWKNNLYQTLNQGDNIFLCHGRARAFSKAFYRQIRWPQIFGEDAFSYLTAKKMGFKFSFNPDAVVFYQSPQTLTDHLRQSTRFINSAKNLSVWFSKTQLQSAYKISRSRLIKVALLGFWQRPVYSLFYLGLFSTSWFSAHLINRVQLDYLWQPSTSTKKLFSNPKI